MESVPPFPTFATPLPRCQYPLPSLLQHASARVFQYLCSPPSLRLYQGASTPLPPHKQYASARVFQYPCSPPSLRLCQSFGNIHRRVMFFVSFLSRSYLFFSPLAKVTFSCSPFSSLLTPSYLFSTSFRDLSTEISTSWNLGWSCTRSSCNVWTFTAPCLQINICTGTSNCCMPFLYSPIRRTRAIDTGVAITSVQEVHFPVMTFIQVAPQARSSSSGDSSEPTQSLLLIFFGECVY